LSPFNYHPLVYEASTEDKQKIKSLIAYAEEMKKQNTPVSDTEIWMRISNVYKTSRTKIPIFDDFISKNQHLLKRCIIFVENREYGDEVLRVVHKYRHDFHTYYAAEDSETLNKFARGQIECMITCHRLSEGIDIKSLLTVVLFSSARSRLETIQRIGRCLRSDPDDPSKTANVIDFIRISESDSDENADEERARWLEEISQIKCEEG